MNNKLSNYGKVEKTETGTVDIREFDTNNTNIFESIVIMGKRARQINNDIKEEFDERALEVTSVMDNMEEYDENEDRIELSRKFEQLAKPSIIAMEEFVEDKTYFRKPNEEA